MMNSIPCSSAAVNLDGHENLNHAASRAAVPTTVRDVSHGRLAFESSFVWARPSPTVHNGSSINSPPLATSRPPAVVRSMHPTSGDLERCCRRLRQFTTKSLRDHIDVYLVAWDGPREQGECEVVAQAKAQWNAVRDAIDRRDVIASEAVS
jgi:hypothetical protein